MWETRTRLNVPSKRERKSLNFWQFEPPLPIYTTFPFVWWYQLRSASIAAKRWRGCRALEFLNLKKWKVFSLSFSVQLVLSPHTHTRHNYSKHSNAPEKVSRVGERRNFRRVAPLKDFSFYILSLLFIYFSKGGLNLKKKSRHLFFFESSLDWFAFFYYYYFSSS